MSLNEGKQDLQTFSEHDRTFAFCKRYSFNKNLERGINIKSSYIKNKRLRLCVN